MFVAVGIGLLVVASFTITPTFHLSLTASVLAAYVVASAEIVVLAEGLSPFHAIRLQELLVAEALVAATASALWIRRGTPLPTGAQELWRLASDWSWEIGAADSIEGLPPPDPRERARSGT